MHWHHVECRICREDLLPFQEIFAVAKTRLVRKCFIIALCAIFLQKHFYPLCRENVSSFTSTAGHFAFPTSC